MKEETAADLIWELNNVLPVGILAIDKNGLITYANNTLSDLLAWLPQNAIGLKLEDVVPSVGRSVSNGLKKRMHTYDQVIVESAGFLRISLIPVDYQNNKVRLVGLLEKQPPVAMDRQNAVMNDSFNSRLENILDYSFDGLWICDATGKVLHINDTAARLNNSNARDIVGRNTEELVSAGVIDRSVTMEVMKSRESVTFIQNLKSGKRLLTSGSPMVDDNGELILVIINERDITEMDELSRGMAINQKLVSFYRSLHETWNPELQMISDNLFQSGPMLKVLKKSKQFAGRDCPVMIFGEFGSGRKGIARYMHLHSKRKDNPFIIIDCKAIPGDRIENELFGLPDEKDCGINTNSIGLLDATRGATLCFSMIHRLSRQLQNRLFEYLNTPDTISGNRSESGLCSHLLLTLGTPELRDAVKTGKFHPELYELLSRESLNVPPLHGHAEDIELIAGHFVARFNRLNGTNKILEKNLIEHLSSQPIEGNITELFHLLEQAAGRSKSDMIGIDDLPSSTRPMAEETGRDGRLGGKSLSEAVDQYEKQLIIEAFKHHSSQKKVAAMLGVNQSTLSRKLSKYRLKKYLRS